ncbi:MAG: anhydro-N-acetylmuramic acid kinase [Bacteroidales bacterium]
MQTYNAIGIMSGTSLDGLDIVWVQFEKNNLWNFKIKKSTTIKYSSELSSKLLYANQLTGLDLVKLSKDFGRFIGTNVNDFIKDFDCKIDFIASHGHTVFHQPDKGITLQIGDGNEIVTTTGLQTICDFRSLDVALGGQGAPLVPIGDRHLFADFDFCINIGGFANISFEKDNKRLAYDICPANIVLNHLVKPIGHEFDKDGEIARSGNFCKELYQELNELDYYELSFPKSLGREWLEGNFFPVLDKYDITTDDKLNTVCYHIANQIVKSTNLFQSGKILITGGGAYNSYLIELIKNKSKHQLVIPDKQIVEYKEALIFAFLGLLKINNQINCMASVTGAQRDSCCGVIYNP